MMVCLCEGGVSVWQWCVCVTMVYVCDNGVCVAMVYLWQWCDCVMIACCVMVVSV